MRLEHYDNDTLMEKSKFYSISSPLDSFKYFCTPHLGWLGQLLHLVTISECCLAVVVPSVVSSVTST